MEAVYDLGDFKLQSGVVLPDAKLAYEVMPCDTDTYFRVADDEIEVSKMPNAELKVIHSVWGHCAGFPAMSPDDPAFVDAALPELLANPAA